MRVINVVHISNFLSAKDGGEEGERYIAELLLSSF